jgi:uncharacterized protein with HEPN domain
VRARPHGLYVGDMLSAMSRIERYVEGLTFDDFVRSDIVIDAVIRNFEVTGEAALLVVTGRRAKP